jgi:hypothetical protein
VNLLCICIHPGESFPLGVVSLNNDVIYMYTPHFVYATFVWLAADILSIIYISLETSTTWD